MSTKPISPYVRLRRIAMTWASSVVGAHRKRMWLYPKAKLADRWSLVDLYERVAAADQLGWNVQIKAADEGLVVEYVQRHPDIPSELYA